MMTAAALFNALFSSLRVWMSDSSILEKTPPSINSSIFFLLLRSLLSDADNSKMFLIS